jgi:ferredoxin
MKARVNEDLCTGCGPCEDTCPEVFQIQGDVATVKVDLVPEGAKERCKEARDNCPTDAISIED